MAATRKVYRESLSRKCLHFVGKLIGLVQAAGAYAFGWERNVPEVVHLAVQMPDLPKPFIGTRVVHFSDLHVGHYCGSADVKRVADLIRREKPDLICFTGDLVEESAKGLSSIALVLGELQAPLGKYAVLGNHDYRAREQQQVSKAWTSAGFEVLQNRHVRLNKMDSSIFIAGIDDALYGVPDLAMALEGIVEGQTVILLSHEADIADQAAAYPVRLQLSGHSHGGQVRLPFLGAILTPKLGEKYVQGLHRVSSRLQVYTTRGIGTTILPIRFLCRPELTVLTLI